jgi:hypothetical protein
MYLFKIVNNEENLLNGVLILSYKLVRSRNVFVKLSLIYILYEKVVATKSSGVIFAKVQIYVI